MDARQDNEPDQPAKLSPTHQSVKSAARTVEIMEFLARSPGMHSLREIQEVLGHPKSSLYALLRTLVDAGWVEQDRTETLYGIGLRALLVGMSYVDGDEMVALAGPCLNWLATETGETVHLARLEGTDVVYLATRDSSHELRVISRVGHRLPAHATALGKALLAERSDEELKTMLPENLEALTPRTITNRDNLLADLARIRRRGYSVDGQENTSGLRCVGVAIPHRGVVRDAISCSVPVNRMNREREASLGQLLLVGRERILREGWIQGPALGESMASARRKATDERSADHRGGRKDRSLPAGRPARTGLEYGPGMTTYFYTASAATGDLAGYRLDPVAGTLTRVEIVKAGGNLSAIAIDAHPGRRLYVADRTMPGIVTFAVDPADGTLSRLAVTPTGSQLVYLSLSADRRAVYGASYGDSTVCEHPIDPDGVVGAAAQPQLLIGADAYCHAVLEAPVVETQRGDLWVTALGHDQLHRIGHDAATGGLVKREPPVQASPSSGPRHLCLSRQRSEIYVIGERSARVTAFSLTDGTSREWTTVPDTFRLAPGIVHRSGRENPTHDPETGLPYTWAADLVLSQDERMLFSSERSSSTVSITSALTGELLAWTRTERQPRGIAIDPSGRFLLVTGELSRTVSLYHVHADGRKLDLVHQVPAPPGLQWAEATELNE